MSELLERVERLERQNERLKRLVAAAFVGIVGLLVCAASAPQPETVRVQGLEVVDEAGKARIRLALDHEMPSLTILDANGKPRARLAQTRLRAAEGS